MRSSLVFALCVAGVLSGGFLLLEELGAASGELKVEQVHANLVRVEVNGEWEEFPLMPLADHLCKSPNRLFEKYCGDELLAPESDRKK